MFYKIKRYFLMAEAGGDDGGGGGGGGGGDNGGGGNNGGGGGGGKPWYDGFKDAGVKDWLTSYNNAYPDPESIAVKAFSLEKFLGAEKAGRGVVVPKSDAKPDEWKAFYSKSGLVPQSVDGYKIPEVVAKDQVLSKDPIVAKFREKAFNDGIPVPIFDSMLAWYANEAASSAKTRMAEYERRADQDLAALKEQWPGVEYDKNVEFSRRAAAAFIPKGENGNADVSDFITRMEGAVGTKVAFEFLANIGKAMGEHNFVAGDNGLLNTGGMTPEAARVRISNLKKDPDFSAKYLAGGAAEKEEWDRLHKIAFSPQSSA